MLVIHKARIIRNIKIYNIEKHKTGTKYTRKDLDTVKGTAVPVHVIQRVAEKRHSVLARQ